MLDGAAQIKRLVDRAKAQNQSAIAITDHGYLFGAYEFWSAARKAGIKPIIGLEAYVTPGTSRKNHDRVTWGTPEQSKDDVSARGAYTHMTLLARNNAGMHDLFRLGSLASLEGQMSKWPRVDRELLEHYGKNLIGTTGCPSGEIQTRLRLGQYDEAFRAAGELQEIFGKDYFYAELMDHGLDIERRVQNDLLDIAKKLNIPLIATNDSHYVDPDDQPIQDALLCINSGSRLNDQDRFTFDGTGYYLRSTEEMRDIFRDFPEACDNTLLVAQQCDVAFKTAAEGADFMPRFPVPAGEDEHSWFIKEVERGLQRRFPNGIPDAERKQADYECGIIAQMGFPGYFLVVADFINWAKDHGIRVGPGRGSGAGSIVAYAMGITELNPLEHGLMFERFLNPERVSMPDIDVDFDERRRQEVIDYVSDKYGSDKVSQVVTYGRIKAKQALKDAARILDKPYSLGEMMTKAMPPAIMGKDISLSGIYDSSDPRYPEAAEFRDFVEKNPQETESVLELAKGLEGLTRQWGVHACAVIMSSEPLTDIIPIMKRPADGAIITQFDYPTCENLGLLKMDFLGLRNLTVLSDALDNIVANNKASVDLSELPLDDAETYKLLSRGDTLGVFQLDSSGMRSLLKQLKPTNFADISALGALYRPGPMGANSHVKYALRKNGQQHIEPIHPELADPLADILDETYGLIVYQEQVMAIARKVAGYSLGEADILRRAMGKKHKDEMDQQFEKFSTGMADNGYSREAIQTLWDILVPFSSYAFNKSHSAAYGLVSYWTAYLKTHYPVEYMAALLTSTKDDKTKSGLYLRECRHLGITVLPPDMNASSVNFSADGDNIRFGLSAVRNVGEKVVEEIIAARENKGDYVSFQDFIDKVPLAVLNRRVIESLILAGAFDSTGVNRRSLFAVHQQAVDEATELKKNEALGQFDLFAAVSGGEVGQGSDPGYSWEIPDMEEWPKKEKLNKEREMLGLYVSAHPLDGLDYVLAENSDMDIATITAEDSIGENARVQLCGLVSDIQRKTNKKTGKLWAIVTLEDMTGSIDLMFWANTYEKYSLQLATDEVISVSGLVSYRDGIPQVSVREMTIPEIVDSDRSPVAIRLPVRRCTPENLEEIKRICQGHRGIQEVHLHLVGDDATRVVKVSEEYGVNADGSFAADMKVLLGADCFVKRQAS